MEKHLKAFLRDNERVEWRSRPDQLALLDADNNTPILRRWGVTVLVTLTLLSVYGIYGEVNPKLVVLALGIALYNLAAPLLVKRDISKFQQYYITNQRVILGGKDAAFFYMDFADIDEIKVVTGLGGRKSLVMGSSVFEKCEKQLRWLALHPKEDPDPAAVRDRVIGITFYEPKNVETACDLLRAKICLRETSRSPRGQHTKNAA